MNKPLGAAGWRPVTWPPEKLAAVESELKSNPARSDLLISKITDTSKASVLRIRNAMTAEGVVPFIDPKLRKETADDRLCMVRYHFKKRSAKNNEKSFPLGTNDSRAIKVPEGKLLSDIYREVLKVEQDQGLTPDRAALAVGTAKQSYRKGRIIVMLADNADLSKTDRATAVHALEVMDKYRSSTKAYPLIERLDKQVWGDRQKVHRNPKTIRKHAETFETNIAVILEVCTRSAEATIPPLSKEAILSTMEQLEESISLLRELFLKLSRRQDHA